IAMWAAFAAGLIAALRKWLRWRPMRWRMVHASLAGVVVVGTVVHALLIEGTMELLTKVGLCTLVILVMAKVAVDMRASIRVSRRKA
ncbi:MAG: ferric reductase, partial [Pseudomonadota bacterium]